MRLIVLVGMIASGKSTLAKKLASEGAVIVNDDAIVTAVHGGDYTLYERRLKPLYKSIENHITTTGIALGRCVVVDRGVNVSRSARARWVALARSLDIPSIAVCFPNEGAHVHAERRHTHDARGCSFESWLEVAKRHEADFSIPTLDEGFNRVVLVDHSELFSTKGGK